MYCTVEEVREMLKEDALNLLLGNRYITNPDQRETAIIPIIQGAILDAEGEIDGYLSKRYQTPLSVVHRSINKIAKDIAVYNLFSRMGIGENERNHLTRYQAGIGFLRILAEGKVDIGIQSRGQLASSGFRMRSNPRNFSRKRMRGM